MNISRKLVACVAVLAALAAGSIAVAAVPDAGGVIHTCWSPSKGTWHPIDTAAGQSCKATETPINIKQKPGIGPLTEVAASTAEDSTNVKKVSVKCPSGKVKVSGGAAVYAADSTPVALTRVDPS